MTTAPPPAAPATRIGVAVGGLFGLVFVLLNAGGLLDQPGALVLQVVAVVVLAGILWFGVVRARGGVGEPPGPNAMAVYNVTVIVQVVAILAGAILFNALLDRGDLVLPWVVVVVGAHFVPFARTFRAPVFRPLAAALVVVGAVGLVTTAAGVAWAGPASGVVAGFLLQGVAAVSALRSTERPAAT